MTPLKFSVAKEQLKTLTPNERKILPFLEKAVTAVDDIYQQQEDGANSEGADFYPKDASKREIELAAQLNPDLFSPFTVVERDESGELIATPYSQKYSKQIEPIVKALSQAAKNCQNKSFKKYLDTLASALLNDDYQVSDISWLQIENSNLDVIIGPHERNLDKLFFVKRAFQGHVGIIDRQKSEHAKTIRDILYTNIGENPHRIIPPSIVNIQLEHNIISSGLIAKLYFTEQHLPSEAEITLRYGSKILNYISSMDYKFNHLILPIYNAIFEKNFKAGYSVELLKTGNYYHNLLQSIVQQLHRYRDARSRLKELFPIYDEANGLVGGVQHAKHLVLKGVINQKELEAIMIADICWIFSEWVLAKRIKGRDSFLKGDALAFNFLLRQGAILEKDGISWPNFAKMFFEIENLSSIFSHIQESGSYLDAQEFLARYLSYKPFESFETSLSKIKSL